MQETTRDLETVNSLIEKDESSNISLIKLVQVTKKEDLKLSTNKIRFGTHHKTPEESSDKIKIGN